MNNLRVAWLLPTAWFYWQPVLSEFTALFPGTKIFTALFPGFISGKKESLTIEIVGQQVKVKSKNETAGYGSKFTYLSPKVVINLFQYKPQVIFSSSFGVWTILALLFKPLGRWKVIIAYEGSSPSVDYRNSWLRLAVRRTMIKMADAYISNSEAGKRYLIDYLGANPKYAFAQPYEVPDLDTWSESASVEDCRISPENDIDNFNNPIFLFVGRIIPRKGLQLLLEACILLKEKGIDDYSVVIIGDGSQKSELEAFSIKHNLEDQVKWLGRIDYSKLGNYLNLADVFVLPTLEDTWGMVILEAMLCGKPILCSTAAGASELVQEGENGYCFPSNDIEKLASAIANFTTDPNLSSVMGTKSRKIIAHHTPEKAAFFLQNVVNLVTKAQLTV